MTNIRRASISLVFLCCLAGAARADLDLPRPSPFAKVAQTVGYTDITVDYSSPGVRGRKIWGGLVPYGKVWRTGADEATLLTTATPIEIGGYSLPAGTYSLFTVPYEDGTAKLVINKKTGQWGIPYNEEKEKDNELERVNLRKTDLDKPVDQFTMAIEPQAGGGGELRMMWEKAQYSVPFTVKK